MPEFYYETYDEESAYRIDDVSQQILVYLYSDRISDLEDLVDKVGVASKSEIDERLKEYLGPDAAGLITQSESTQQTIGEKGPLLCYELTEKGEQFVENNKATLSMPANFEELADTIGELRTDVVEMRDSMHRVDADELSEQLSRLARRLESLQTRVSDYD